MFRTPSAHVTFSRKAAATPHSNVTNDNLITTNNCPHLTSTAMVCDVMIFVLLGLAQFWASPGADAYAINPLYGNNHYNNYNPYNQGPTVEKQLQAFQRQVNERLGALENAVTSLASESCRTGRASIQNCPGFREAAQKDIFLCVIEPITGNSGAISQAFNVPFDPPFLNTPVVEVSFNGQAILLGKNCSLEIMSASNNEFTFLYTTDDFYAVASNITWFACPSALLQPGQPLSSIPRLGRAGNRAGLPVYTNFVVPGNDNIDG